jgi:Family of unknown function (DUF5906)
LSQVSNAHLEKSLEAYRKADAANPFHDLLVDFMDTYPGKDAIVQDGENRIWNLWTKPWITATYDKSPPKPKWFLEVVERFFGEYEAEREWFLDWCAHLVCRPDIKMPVSVLLTSGLNGAGKGFIAEALKFMVGPRNYKNITGDIVKSSFQSFVPGTSLAVVHELYEQGNYSFADRLKTMQSEDEMFVNMKYGPQQSTRNMVHLLCFSNRSSPIHLEEGDRRWFTFASPMREKAPQEWWDKRWRLLKHPDWGLPAKKALGDLRRWFEDRYENIKVTRRFNPFDRPPETENKATIVDDSRSAFYLKIREMLAEGTVPGVKGKELTTIPAIEGSLGTSIRMPSNGQKRQDLEALGFTWGRRKDGRFWRLPEGFQAIGAFGPADARM